MDNAIRRLCVDTCVPFSARGVSVLLRQPVFWRSARARQMCAVSSSGGGVSIGFGQASASLRWLCTGRSSPGWIRRAVDIDLVLDHQRNMLYDPAFGDSGVPGESVLVQERESAEDRCRVELSGDLVAFSSPLCVSSDAAIGAVRAHDFQVCFDQLFPARGPVGLPAPVHAIGGVRRGRSRSCPHPLTAACRSDAGVILSLMLTSTAVDSV